MAYLLVYQFSKIKPKERLRFMRELYGFKDYSNRGRYIYPRRGILKEGDYEKISNGVLLVKRNINKVKIHIKKYGGQLRTFNIKD